MQPDVQEALFGRTQSEEDAEAQKKQVETFCDDCTKTFSTPHGESVFWTLMEVSRVFSPLPDHGVWNQRAEGMRLIGLLLLSGMGFGHSYGHLSALNRSLSRVKAEDNEGDNDD